MSTIEGVVDYIGPREVRGWAFDGDAPDNHLQVFVTLNDVVLATASAGQFRADLLAAGIGVGNHGFAIPFESQKSSEALAAVRIFVLTRTGERQALPTAVDAIEPQGKYVDLPGAPALPSRIDAVHSLAQDDTQRPVFIMGAARSGTSAIAQALLKCGTYQGFEEGHFLWLLESFFQTIGDYYRLNGEDGSGDRFTMLSYVPYSHVTNAVRNVFIETVRKLFPTGIWIDKTPKIQMIRSARLMQELWPNARFIFMKRRGIENVRSRLLKFSAIEFDAHCQDWAAAMESWLEVRDLLGGSALEIEQLAMYKNPEKVADALRDFLLLPPDSAANVSRSLALDRPEATPAAVLGAEGSLPPWTEKQWSHFRRICGPMMAAYGYAYTDEYFAAPFPSINID